MWWRNRGPLALLALAFVAAAPTTIAQSFSSAPIDPSLFRDGEVERSTRTFGDWVLVCDEIVRLKRRFCSLRTAPLDDRRTQLRLDVSTGDDGRPAALLHLPTSLALEGVSLRASVSRSGSTKSAVSVHPVTFCTGNECQSVWSMTVAEIDALTAGRDITATYRPATMADLPILSVRLHKLPDVHFRISGDGFREAIGASLH